eukprot:SAG25_NODE_1396_length_3131_cov_5.049802_3_plen_45_part_01
MKEVGGRQAAPGPDAAGQTQPMTARLAVPLIAALLVSTASAAMKT